MAKNLIGLSDLQADILMGVIGELLDSNPDYYQPLSELYDEIERISK